MCGEDIKAGCGKEGRCHEQIKCAAAICYSGDGRSDLLMLFSPLKIDLMIWGGTDTQQRKRSLCLPALPPPPRLPHFRSAPQQMQTSYDTFFWAAAFPLA